MTIKKVLIIMICFYSCKSGVKFISEKEKQDLSSSLENVWKSDQMYRVTASTMRNENQGKLTLEEAELWKKQSLADSVNMEKIEKIIFKYGYPGKELVGDSLKSVGAFVILHNPQKQEKYLKMLWKESDRDNVDKREVATLEDRIRMIKGKKQIYGTGMISDTISINHTNGEVQTKLRIWDIKDMKNIDKKRESVGLYSFKLQCELMGFDWKKYASYEPQANKYDFNIQDVQR
jgi:hypothetical protein